MQSDLRCAITNRVRLEQASPKPSKSAIKCNWIYLCFMVALYYYFVYNYFYHYHYI